MTVDILPVSPQHVRNVWPLAEKYVTDALAFGAGCFEASDICDLCEKGSMQLWLGTKGDDVLAAVVTEITDYPRKRVVSVPFIGGRSMRSWFRKMLYEIEAWSKEMGCVAMQGGARRGWGKLAKMKETGVVLFKDYDMGAPLEIAPPQAEARH